MPHRTYTPTSKAQRARQYLTKGGVTREDSDDELGLEDHPWEWIYSSSSDTNSKKKKKKITGAKMGSFSCVVGDVVFLKAEGNGEAWVGIICEFMEDEEEGEKCANFMWFSSEREIRNKAKKRTDFLWNELYITPSWDINPLASINGKATVTSPEKFNKKYPSGKVPRTAKNYGKIFVCRRGCNTRTCTYTDEFIWEDIFKGEESIDDLIDLVKTQTKGTRKRKLDDTIYEHKEDAVYEHKEDHISDNDNPKTPTKKRKYNTTAGTPQSKSKQTTRTPQKYTTPTHKRIIVKKPLEFTPLGTRILDPSYTTSSPFQLARQNLHVSAVPSTLPCREEAFSAVYSHLEAAITDGSGCCIYISGVPGTGKTATVREVVAQLDAAVLAEELDDFIFVEVNGMKVTDPHQAYSLLWEALRGDRVSPSHALELLEREFSHPNPRRVPCVVLMDELDQLVTKNQSVMYNFFNWPSLRHSRLIVLAVANTMDLPERTLSNKISSRLGLTRITFPGYNHEQLMKIIQSRLEGVPGNIVDPDAVQFASRKVAAVSGDARRALDICRRAVEIAETESLAQDNTPDTPSKKYKDKVVDKRATQKKSGRVTISTVKQAINEATSSPLQQSLRYLPLSSKLFLAALLGRMTKTGIAECVLGDIIEESKRLGPMADENHIQDFLLMVENLPEKDSMSTRGKVAPSRVFAMGSAAMELMEAGVVSIEQRRGERIGKIRLNVGEDEIKVALKGDSEVRGLGFAS